MENVKDEWAPGLRDDWARGAGGGFAPNFDVRHKKVFLYHYGGWVVAIFVGGDLWASFLVQCQPMWIDGVEVQCSNVCRGHW